MPGTSGSDHTLAGPDDADSSGTTPPAHVEESDPSADSRQGLAGDMGVSSERRGPVRGLDEEVTYGAAPTHPDDEAGDAPPEQSARDGRPEVNPDSPGAHPSDPDSNPGHGI